MSKAEQWLSFNACGPCPGASTTLEDAKVGSQVVHRCVWEERGQKSHYFRAFCIGLQHSPSYAPGRSKICFKVSVHNDRLEEDNCPLKYQK